MNQIILRYKMEYTYKLFILNENIKPNNQYENMLYNLVYDKNIKGIGYIDLYNLRNIDLVCYCIKYRINNINIIKYLKKENKNMELFYTVAKVSCNFIIKFVIENIIDINKINWEYYFDVEHFYMVKLQSISLACVENVKIKNKTLEPYFEIDIVDELNQVHYNSERIDEEEFEDAYIYSNFNIYSSIGSKFYSDLHATLKRIEFNNDYDQNLYKILDIK